MPFAALSELQAHIRYTDSSADKTYMHIFLIKEKKT